MPKLSYIAAKMALRGSFGPPWPPLGSLCAQAKPQKVPNSAPKRNHKWDPKMIQQMNLKRNQKTGNYRVMRRPKKVSLSGVICGTPKRSQERFKRDSRKAQETFKRGPRGLGEHLESSRSPAGAEHSPGRSPRELERPKNTPGGV